MRASTRTRLTGLVALVALVGLCSTAQAQKVYQWKDSQGVTHYSDSPPPGGAKDRRIDNRGEPESKTAAAKPAEDPQCTMAKANLQVLDGKNDVQQDTDGDGKPDKTLGTNDRANQRELASAAVKAYCKPAA